MESLLVKFKAIIKEIVISRNYIWNRPMLYMHRARRFDFFPGNEYVRGSSLELVAQEIYDNGVSGSVAELGVYQGEFAKLINKAFPDRKLYLFDTFEGFDPKDIALEVEHNYSLGSQDFSNTSIDLVMEKMAYKDNCVVKKGNFPDSLGGLDETFAFVSIDADLFRPTYDGLSYFFARLERGGYIFIHDYNNDEYQGVKRAVRQFCAEHNVGYFPLTDRCGSVVLIK